MDEVLLPSVHAVVILDDDGNRIYSKYFHADSTKAEQRDFEQKLNKKTKGLSARTESEIMLMDGQVAVFRSGNDTKFFCIGSSEENELIIASVLDTIFETIATLLRAQLDRGVIIDNLELVMLTIDEVVENGQIVELDPSAVANRVLMRGVDGGPVRQF